MKKIFMSAICFALMISGRANADLTSKQLDEKSLAFTYADEVSIWPINETTKEVPYFKDMSRGRLDEHARQLVNYANAEYDKNERSEIIDFCRHTAFVKNYRYLEKKHLPGVAAKLKNPNDPATQDMKKEFEYCTVGMITQWRKEDGIN